MNSHCEEMNWVNNQIELEARNINTPDDAAAWYKKTKLDLSALIQMHKIPIGLQEMMPSDAPDLSARFSECWKWKEFKQKTFRGAKFTKVEVAREPFESWTELISLIANHVASSRAMLAKL